MPAQYPNNLNEIYGGSSIAAMNATMQQQANAEAQDRLDQQRQTLANQFTEQVNPIKLQQEQANLDTTNAELPGKQAQSRILNTNANIGEATQDTDIKAKLSSNRTKMSDDEITQHGNILRGLAGVAGMIDQGAPLPLDMQQAMEQKYPGMLQKLQDPRVRQKIVQGNKLWAEMDQKHQRDKELEKMRLDVTQSEGKANRQTQWDIANLRYDTMREQWAAKASQSAGAKNWAQASIQWNNIADTLETERKSPQAAQARERAQFYANLELLKSQGKPTLDMEKAANEGNFSYRAPTTAPLAPPVNGVKAKEDQQQVIEIGGRKFTRNPTQ
jgi:hypothetical protein